MSLNGPAPGARPRATLPAGQPVLRRSAASSAIPTGLAPHGPVVAYGGGYPGKITSNSPEIREVYARA